MHKQSHRWMKVDVYEYKKDRNQFLTLEEAAMFDDMVPKYRCVDCGVLRYETRMSYIENECAFQQVKNVMKS